MMRAVAKGWQVDYATVSPAERNEPSAARIKENEAMKRIDASILEMNSPEYNKWVKEHPYDEAPGVDTLDDVKNSNVRRIKYRATPGKVLHSFPPPIHIGKLTWFTKPYKTYLECAKISLLKLAKEAAKESNRKLGAYCFVYETSRYGSTLMVCFLGSLDKNKEGNPMKRKELKTPSYMTNDALWARLDGMSISLLRIAREIGFENVGGYNHPCFVKSPAPKPPPAEEDIEWQREFNKAFREFVDWITASNKPPPDPIGYNPFFEAPADQPEHYDGERCDLPGSEKVKELMEERNIDHFEFTGEQDFPKIDSYFLQSAEIWWSSFQHTEKKYWILRPVYKKPKFKVGDWVVHEQYGIGMVKSVVLPPPLIAFENGSIAHIPEYALRHATREEIFAHGLHYTPPFKAGDWVIKAGLVGCSDNFPFQLTEKHIETLYYREDGQYSVTLMDGSTAVTWVITHATEDDWRFERNGVRVMAKQLDGWNKGKIELHADAECTMYDEYNRNLAKALDIPIQPAGWEEKK